MKRILLASLFVLGLTYSNFAQLNGVVVEKTTDGSFNFCGASTQPLGTTTYRVYAELQDADDMVSAIAALDGCHPMNISTTTTFFNSPMGGALGNNLNTALCGVVPDGGFDSFITIGQANSSDAGVTQAAFTNPADPLTGAFADVDGTNFDVVDGTIFTLNGNTNGLPVGPDNRVFLGQFTTDGDFSFDINLQVFDGGNGSQSLYYVSSGELDCFYDPQNPFPNMPTVLDGSEIGLIYDSVNDCEIPVNDLCAGAINIDDQINQGPFAADNTCATVSGVDSDDCGSGNNDLWYSFTYNGGTVTIETILSEPNGGDYCETGELGDSKIVVWSDCGQTEIACNDDVEFSASFNGLESLVRLNEDDLILGEEYLIQVSGYEDLDELDSCFEDAVGAFEMQISQCTVSNDFCANAINIDDQINQGPFAADNSCATESGVNSAVCDNGNNDLWYAFTYTGGSVTIETILSEPNEGDYCGSGELGDSKLVIWSDCGQTEIACNDDSPLWTSMNGLESWLRLGAADLVMGDVYYIQATGYSSLDETDSSCVEEAVGAFEIQVTQCDIPNDICSGAISINDQIDQGPFAVDNSCASVSGIVDDICQSDAPNDLWYSFTYTGGEVVLQTYVNYDYDNDEPIEGQLYDTNIAVYSDCSAESLVACNEDFLEDESYLVLDDSMLQLGQTYYIQLGGDENLTVEDFTGELEKAVGAFEFEISILTACSAPNDDCDQAISIDDQVNQGAFDVDNSCATVSDIYPEDCHDELMNDLWYSFTYNGGTYIIETIMLNEDGTDEIGILDDSVLAIYESCSYETVACNDDNVGNESYIELDEEDLTIGETYLIQVGGVDGNFLTDSDWNDFVDTFGAFQMQISQLLEGCTDQTAINYDAAATIDDGSCSYSEINDFWERAESLGLNIAAGPGTSCNGLNEQNMFLANANDADNVPLSDFAEMPGLWYSFIPFSSGNQITVETEDFDAVIELYDVNLGQVMSVNDLPSENANDGIGNGIFQVGNLTAGDVYFIRVLSTTTLSENAMFNVCVQTFRDTRCDYPDGTYNLCQMYKADFVYCDAYQFHFTSQTTGETYSSNAQTSTFLVLRNVEGLPFGDTYDVEIESIYYMQNGAGTPQTVVVANDEPCEITIADAPMVKLRSSDNIANHGPHYPGNYIRTNSYACGAVAYTWKFTRTDIAELPQEYTTATASTFVRISDVLGNSVTPGGVYDVQVKPVFENGQESEYGEVEAITLIGAAGVAGDVIVANEFDEDALRDEAQTTPDSNVYPNPTSGAVNIVLTNLGEDELIEVSVTDFLGRTVAQSAQVAQDGSVLMNMELSNLAAGTYLMHITAGEYVQTEKLVIVK